MNNHFRLTVWDPSLIVAQIVCLQAYFYFAYGALLILVALLVSVDTSMYNVLSYKAINFSDRSGICTLMCYLLTALVGSVGLWMFVKRTKQCLDFTVTCYVIHILLSWMYSGSAPSTLSWWLFTTVGVTVMCVCGEFLCLRSELQDIPLLGGKVELE